MALITDQLSKITLLILNKLKIKYDSFCPYGIKKARTIVYDQEGLIYFLRCNKKFIEI